MSTWKDLLYRTDLSHQEIRQIPGATCENYIAAMRYWVDKRGYTESELIEGMEISEEEFRNEKNWLNTLDGRRFNSNIFKYARRVISHHETYYGGLDFQFLNNSLLMYFFKVLSAGRIIAEVEKHVTKFNNAYSMRSVGFKSGETYIQLQNYPYYNSISTGVDCRFTEGCLAANFEIHQIKNYQTRHIICSSRIENLVESLYSNYGLKLRVDGRFYYLNEAMIGRKVRLRHMKVNKEEILHDVIDESAEKDWNAVQIIRDYLHKGVTLFFAGEIYNAPYCLMHLEWKEPFFLKRMYNGFSNRRLFQKNFDRIENQIEFTNVKLFQAQESLLESQKKSSIFSVYTRSSLVKAVDSGDNPLNYIPEEQRKTILFSDIRDFTNLAESMTPIDIVRFLNSYYNRVSDCISSAGGEIDKLIGDCIMAVFDDADSAVSAAIETRQHLSEYNRERIQYGHQKIRVGIGITTGAVIAGNIGSKYKMDYTFVGDTVNIASRLEALTKYYNIDIIISEQTLNQLKTDFQTRFIDSVLVKGKNKPIHIYEVYDYLPGKVQKIMQNSLQQMNQAFKLYQAGEFEQSLEKYIAIKNDLDPHQWNPDFCMDPILHFYIKRCQDYIEKLKAGIELILEWNGIYTFMDK